MRSESKTREQFNRKYGDYLPISIQGNLWAEPIEILVNHEEVEVSQAYEFIDKIDTKKEAVAAKFQEILLMVFKDASFAGVTANDERLKEIEDSNLLLTEKA
jgi:hypothetical protein